LVRAAVVEAREHELRELLARHAKERLVREVEEEMHREFEREVPSLAIGKRVADKLRAIDHVAYIRFASEYYQFSSAGEFQREIDDLAERPVPEPGQPDLF
jgi:transcriptional regulator NrdR family protein